MKYKERNRLARLLHRSMVRIALCLITVIFLEGVYSHTAVRVQAEDQEQDTESEEFQGQLYARSAVLMDGDSGRVLYGKDEDVPRPMASTTKIMTCILALEQMKDDTETVKASENAAGQPKVHLGVSVGEEYYLKDLLYSLMLESHNDSAVMIAEHIGGSVRGFASLMNEKARELGCENTYFITPNGLDAADEKGVHSTTAKELARIMKYCIHDSDKSGEFLQITGTQSYSFQDVSGSRSFTCSNHNAFLTMMDGALSGKTGFTGDAGYCYVGALCRDGKTFIVALLACGWPNNKSYKWADTRALMEYGLAHYSYRNLWKGMELPDIPVVKGVPDHGDLSGPSTLGVKIEDEPEEWNYLVREDEQADVELNLEKQLNAPVKAGEAVGQISCTLNGESLESWEIVTVDGKSERDFIWCMKQIVDRYIKINQEK
ncbi:MAG: D-alanyl-D-alanine carboxypeptidase family protein [Eubacteriales bacterium]|nr:D-alanyl-D-alanine carboxypeptidase family protein [Eubacteriales bacterium]